jgi:hypothetical protein
MSIRQFACERSLAAIKNTKIKPAAWIAVKMRNMPT